MTANAHKDEAGIWQDNILTRFHGILSHDHESKFYNYGTSHATCGTHLTRNLKGLDELCMVKWAGSMRQFLLEMNARKKGDITQGRTCCDPQTLRGYDQRYDQLMEEGDWYLAQLTEKTLGHSELRKMLNRLREYKGSYLLFMRNYSAPFTNNQAERDLRHCKIKEKVSGCYRAWQGLLDYCKIRSLLATAVKRGLNLIPVLRLSSLALASG